MAVLLSVSFGLRVIQRNCSVCNTVPKKLIFLKSLTSVCDTKFVSSEQKSRSWSHAASPWLFLAGTAFAFLIISVFRKLWLRHSTAVAGFRDALLGCRSLPAGEVTNGLWTLSGEQRGDLRPGRGARFPAAFCCRQQFLPALGGWAAGWGTAGQTRRR